MRYPLTLLIWLVLCMALPQGASALVNINAATLTELDTLPYVGTSTAQLIISGRPYSSTSDIQKISGFTQGPGTRNYDAVIGLITTSGNTTVSTETEVDSDNGSQRVIAEVKKVEAPGPITGLTLDVPKIAYTGQLLSFDVDPSDGKRGRTARYKWNFGDGTTDDFKSPVHRYTHPGTYVVMVESYYQKETKLARKEIEILPLALKMAILSPKEVEVINNGSYEIDLGSMVLVGNSTFSFPKYTILLPDQSLVVAVNNSGSVILKDGEGALLTAGRAEAKAPPRRVSATASRQTTVAVSVPVEAAKAEEISVEEPESREDFNATTAAISSTQPASLPLADVPLTAWPYLALFAVMGLGIFAVYGTRS